MNGNKIAKILIKRLLEKNFIIHRYNSHSTSSIYLKLDYGLSCGIRIADHLGKKKYHYRFNVIKNYKGDKVVVRDNLVSFYFNHNELEDVIEKVVEERQKKVDKYGIDNYNRYMKMQSNNDLYKRFFEMKGV